ncbi:two-component response regulator [Novosphingobium nitrogenifigens DSM 19370]|uniref:Two-component response regulator n=1 Tax=Novosphingobium nitrogenifigens DSM 19370 TaxID=983920 RepID=F1ZBI9_9SPHN|nr:response regulator [Novosphingobium nitrogenifigens]EGD57926.1 two-component response regulator [Novosphingobium nitrogenifigens DSM 19370]
MTFEQTTTPDDPPVDGDGPGIDGLSRNLPYLRRYARAITGSQSRGDRLVQTMLEAAVHDPALLARIAQSRVALYRTFSERAAAGEPATPSQLARVPTRARHALLLNRLEDFSLAETAAILDVDEAQARALVSEALDDIASEESADVLVIEDEPLIAAHLMAIVADAGHRPLAHATTATAAREAFERYRPALVLSDVQLADGSSGIDAVEDILRLAPVPVIFVTGYPEKLLTGEGPEPAFLIRKPFRDETIHATISQALFFGARLAG